MRKYFDVVFLTTSIPASGAYVYVLDSSGNRVPLFSDNGVTSIQNPVTTDRTGFYSFYVADGTYTLQYVLGGITLRTLTAVQIYDESSISSGTATDAGTLTGSETLPMSRGAGLLQTTLTKIAQFAVKTYQPTVRAVGLLADGVTAEGAALVAALGAWPVLQIPADQTVYVNTSAALPDNATLMGPGKIVLGPGGTITVGNGTVISGVKIDGLNKTNNQAGIAVRPGTAGAQILLPTLTNIYGNGISVGAGALGVVIYDPTISNTGGTGIAPSSNGCGIYVGGSECDIIGGAGYIEKTYGYGAVFVNGTTRCNIDGLRIRDTFYRGIDTTGSITGCRITRCNIQRTGSINTSGSGVGCNGIFATGATVASDVVIDGNYIKNAGENCIEGLARIVNNTCLNSNYNGLTTPSIDGIFAYSGAIVENNQIDNAKGCGIKSYNAANAQDISIARNRIRAPGSVGVVVQVDGAGVVGSNIVVRDNEVYDYAAGNSGLGIVQMLATNTASFSGALCTGNRSFGIRTTATIDAAVSSYLNSWNAPLSGLQFSEYRQLSSAQTLSAADLGGLIEFVGSSSFTQALPSAASFPAGGTLTFLNNGTGTITLARAGSDLIQPAPSMTLTAVLLAPGDKLTISATATTYWKTVAGSAQDMYSNVPVTAVPVTGGTVVIASGTKVQIANPAGALSALTVQFPKPQTTSATGTKFTLVITQAITTLTLSTIDSTTIVGGPSSTSGYTAMDFMYNAPNTTWYRVG